MNECFITAKGHNGCINESIGTNMCVNDNISLMHKEFSEVRRKINELKGMLEQVIEVLGGGTIDTFKTPICKDDINVVKPIVLEPERMSLGDNLTHLELMVGEAIQRVNEIKNLIGMDPNKIY